MPNKAPTTMAVKMDVSTYCSTRRAPLLEWLISDVQQYRLDV